MLPPGKSFSKFVVVRSSLYVANAPMRGPISDNLVASIELTAKISAASCKSALSGQQCVPHVCLIHHTMQYKLYMSMQH